MAICSGGYSWGGGYIYVEYSVVSQSISNNTSNVNVWLYGYRGNASSSYAYDSPGASLSIAGVGTYYESGNFDYRSNSVVLLVAKNVTIKHDSSGNANLSVSGVHSTGVSLGTASCSGTVALPTINRYASVTSATWTDNAAGTSYPTIKVSNPGNKTVRYYIAYNSVSTLRHYKNNQNGSSYSFTSDDFSMDDVYRQMVDSQTMTIRLGCYTGSGNTTTSPSSKDITFTIVSASPDINTPTAQDVNASTLVLTGNANKFIKGFSTLRVGASGSPKKFATLKKLQITPKNGSTAGQTKEVEYSVGYADFEASEYNGATVVLVDSRGLTAQRTITISSSNIINYFLPTITSLTVTKTENSTIFDASGTLFYGNFGAYTNQSGFKVQIYIKRRSSSSWGSAIATITTTPGSSNWSVSYTYGTVLSPSYAYDVRVEVSDKLITQMSGSAVYMQTIIGVGEAPLKIQRLEDGRDHCLLPIETVNIEDALGDLTLLSDYIWQKIYPVGSIYMSIVDTDPADLFGGTWVQLEDRFLLGAGDTYSVGSTGGSDTHTLTENEMPAHTHSFASYGDRITAPWSIGSGSTNIPAGSAGNYWPGHWADQTWYAASKGGGQAHNNMPPYLVVYMWKRTA